MATVVLAGGGTAGHIEPALAVAREWLKTNPSDDCIFLGTKSGLENTLVPAAGFKLRIIPKVKISRTPTVSWLRIPIDLISSVLSAKKVLRDADVLIGFGGYVSAPAYLAAALSRTPIVIHEANAKPGWANRLGALFTSHLAVAHPVDRGKFSDALMAGLPLRSDVANACVASATNWATARTNAKLRLGFPADAPLVFIMGGSQGSVAINGVVLKSVSTFNLKGISVLHSVGKLNALPALDRGYRPVAYVDAMADAYLAADLIIARSGAVTCSEFRALGRYALFVPLPIGNGEQFVNAASLVSDGRAEVIEQKEFTTEFIEAQIDRLLKAAARAPINGDDQDLDAAQKIVALTEFAIES
jgi:UDP-N-acetylglucosamine--N-acetylmuramyl-(pentapeptide) pyrophosphoryl-undecaprenol N-acetylglucosamine transferase